MALNTRRSRSSVSAVGWNAVFSLAVKLKTAFHPTAETEERLRRVLSAINHYIVIKILASLATALCIWVCLWILGIEFAVLWGLLAFLLNFIPFISAILMMIPAVLQALLQTDLQTTVLVALFKQRLTLSVFLATESRRGRAA